MQKSALLVCSLVIIALVFQADAITPANNIVCGRAICPSGWVSSDANATPTCPSDCPNSCNIMDDVCCPGRKYGVCSSTDSTAAGGATTVASGSATPTVPAAASSVSMTSGSVSVTTVLSSTAATSSVISSVASVASSTVSSAASSVVSATSAASATSAGVLIHPSYMITFTVTMFCILKSM